MRRDLRDNYKSGEKAAIFLPVTTVKITNWGFDPVVSLNPGQEFSQVPISLLKENGIRPDYADRTTLEVWFDRKMQPIQVPFVLSDDDIRGMVLGSFQCLGLASKFLLENHDGQLVSCFLEFPDSFLLDS